MGDLPELTDKQQALINTLPASSHEIATQLGISKSTVSDHRANLREKGVDIRKDDDAGQWFIASNGKQLRRVSTTTKQSITKQATKLIEEEKRTLMRRLRRTEPLQADPVEGDGNETFCLILADTHFGDIVEKEFWDDDEGEYQTHELYNSEIAADLIQRFAEKALSIRDMMETVTEFDDCVLFVLGDVATGLSHYEGQWQNVDQGMNKQVECSVSALYQLCVTLAEEFETLQFRAIPGNHGTQKPNASLGVNTDLITYSWVDDRLRDSGYDNIDYRYAEAFKSLNTVVRDWRVHLRHGEDSQSHIDKTSRSQADWRGWRDETKFDLAMKGHHHNPGFDKVMNKYPVFSAPSPKPGSEFASRIGSPDVSVKRDLGWAFGMSDERRVTWQFLLDEEL